MRRRRDTEVGFGRIRLSSGLLAGRSDSSEANLINGDQSYVLRDRVRPPQRNHDAAYYKDELLIARHHSDLPDLLQAPATANLWY